MQTKMGGVGSWQQATSSDNDKDPADTAYPATRP